MTTNLIKQYIDQALQTLNLPSADYSVEYPTNQSFGDYSTNIAMVLFKTLKASGNTHYHSPLELAQTIADTIAKNHHEFAHVTPAPPGFINFTLNHQTLIQLINNQLSHLDLTNPQNLHRTVIVEYSSPNIAKPFTIGHLRSTVIGDAIANIKQATGWTVIRDNHLGDWGTQFGKLICAIKKNWIPFDQIEAADNPVKLLVELYVRFHQQAETNPELEDEARSWFKKLEDGDPEARQLWQKCVDWSWKEFSRIYDLLHVKFSPQLNQGRGLGESFFQDKMDIVIKQLEQAKLLTTGEMGAKIVDFGGKFPPLMILKKDGATLYSTRDLATDYYRLHTFHPDLIINEVGAEQSLYFQQIFAIEYALNWYQPGQRLHVGHGMYRFKDGKMSTRKGNVIWLEEVIDAAIAKAKSLIESGTNHSHATNINQLAQQIGVGALKWNDLKGEAKRDITFDWNEILTMKGNSGPYVQYTYARANSIIRKASTPPIAIDQNTQFNTEELQLIRWLIRFPEIVSLADVHHDPSRIATYLYELCQLFNSYYNKHTILTKTSTPIYQHRLTLTHHTATVIKTGLNLLGMTAPESM